MAALKHHLAHFFLGKSTDKPPYLLSLRSSTTFIVITVCLAVFTDIFFYGLVVPVIPFSLTVQVGTPEDEVQEWTAILLSCYSAALFVGSPIAGYYADRTHSRRLPLLIGLIALAASTLMLMLGASMAVLVVGRLLQGLSAAVVWSVGLALLADTMGNNIGVAVGYVSIAMSVGLLVAPVVGGAVYDAAGYYAVYYVAFAVIFLDIVLRLFLVEKKVARQWAVSENDPISNAAEIEAGERVGSSCEKGMAADAEPPDRPDGSSSPADQTTTSGDDGQLEARKPVRPNVALIRSKRTVATLYGIVVQAGIMMAFDTILPLFVKTTFGWDATAAGLAFLALFIPCVVSPAVGWLSDQYGPTWLAVFGFVTSIPLLVCFRFVTQDTIDHKVLLCALLALLGTSLEFSNIPLMAELAYIIEDKERKTPGIFGEKGVYGMAYGLFTTFFALGGTIGSLASGYLMEGPGWGTAMWVLAVWCATGAAVVALWVGGGLTMNPLQARRKSSGPHMPKADGGVA